MVGTGSVWRTYLGLLAVYLFFKMLRKNLFLWFDEAKQATLLHNTMTTFKMFYETFVPP